PAAQFSFSAAFALPPPICTLFPYTTLFRSHLLDWYAYQNRNRLGRYTYNYEETEVNGHPALHLIGRERLLPGIAQAAQQQALPADRKSTRLNSRHQIISYAVFCLKKQNQTR